MSMQGEIAAEASKVEDIECRCCREGVKNRDQPILDHQDVRKEPAMAVPSVVIIVRMGVDMGAASTILALMEIVRRARCLGR